MTRQQTAYNQSTLKMHICQNVTSSRSKLVTWYKIAVLNLHVTTALEFQTYIARNKHCVTKI